ncbi:MAG: hypothetical protein WC494_03040 [Candidatus Pacearchaeota archaeon]
MSLEKTVRKNEKVSFKDRVTSGLKYAAGVGVTLGALAFGTARAEEPAYQGADFNRDGVVDARDLAEYATQWLAESEGKNVIPVYDCGCLNESNAVYVLQNDINAEGNCFDITADGVKFDLRGHILQGNGGGVGVNIKGGFVSVIDGTIYNFASGLQVSSGQSNSISDLTLFQNTYFGIAFEENLSSSVTNTRSMESPIAIQLGSSGGRIQNSSFSGTLYDIDSMGRNVFENCIFQTFSPNSSFKRMHDYRCLVLDKNRSAVDDALVTLVRQSGEVESSLRTRQWDGTPKVTVTSWVLEEGEVRYNAPFSVIIEKEGTVLNIPHYWNPNGTNGNEIIVLE